MNTLPNVQTLEDLPRPEDGPKRRVYENVVSNPTNLVQVEDSAS